MKRALLFPFLIAARALLAASDPVPGQPDKSPSEYYTVEDIAMPPGLSVEVGGLAFMPGGKLVACFHRGEVYTCDTETKEWKLFAQGLQDPLGLIAPKDGEVLVMQRSELTRLRDTDGDGVADSYETICDAFGMSGNYHEFAFGPVAAPDGGWYAALNLASNGSGVRYEVRGEYRERGRAGLMFSAVPWRGWVVKIAPDGKLTPWANGFRSPNGLGLDARGRLFVSDNGGDWGGASAIYHVEKGKFYGHPASLAWKPREMRPPQTIPLLELDKERVRGAVCLPANIMANSPTQPLADSTAGKFGPFAGQWVIGEMIHPRLIRAALEEVGGQLQGMVAPLLDGHGLRTGNNRLAFAPDGSLWVGQTDHGWPGARGIQRISWTNKAPLDVKEMHLTKTGFDLVFTRPLEADSASQAGSYPAQRYYYEYHAAPGAKQLELENITPKTVTVSEDRTKVTIEFDPLTPWRLYQFDLKALKAEDGAPIANPLVIYTLNHLLERTPPPPPPEAAAEGGNRAPDQKPPPARKGAEKKTDSSDKPEPAATPKPADTTPKPAGRKPATPTPAPATPTPGTKPKATPPLRPGGR